MFRTLKLVALSISAALLAAPLAAETTPGPPDWHDGGGTSVYEQLSQQALRRSPDNTPLPTPPPAEKSADIAPIASAPPKLDPALTPAAHDAPAARESNSRRLAPPSSGSISGKPMNQAGRTDGARHRLANFGVPVESVYTVVTALAIVIGAFLVFVWALRRGGKGAAGRRGFLPADAVSVLGRVPLAARQFAELLRVGNKLVLVALTPSGPKTITEVTDPTEVDRLVGLCQQYDPHSTTKAFEQVFQQLSREPTADGFFGADALPTSLSPAAAAYRSHRGDSARG